jgi:hypothetical protein
MSERKRLKDMTDLLERHWSDWSLLSHRKGVVKFELRHGTLTRKLIASAKSADVRKLKNFEQDVKRVVRGLKEGNTHAVA